LYQDIRDIFDQNADLLLILGSRLNIRQVSYNWRSFAREAYKILSEHFGIRQCSDYELTRRKRPCLLYGMKKCLAPCKDLCTESSYKEAVKKVISFLEGQSKELLIDLKQQIHKASEKLEFEKAGALYKTLKQLEQVAFSKQMMVQVNNNDMDIFHLYQEGSKGVFIKLLYREGKVTGQEVMRFNETLDEGKELLTNLILQHYEHHNPSSTIVCPFDPDESGVLTEVLKELKGSKVSFIVPQKGDKKTLLEMAYENAKLNFKQSQDDQLLLLELEEIAKLTRYPSSIECFDLSHFSGSEPVAVKIRLDEGKINKSGKRLYKITTAKGGDDYGGMKEVLTRSLKNSKIEDTVPDLLLIDGGKGQVRMAKEVLEELDIACCDIIGLVKENSRHDKGLTEERLIVSYQTEPLVLDKKNLANSILPSN
jgi:excinuclease ABC subunit C